jgi:hypothetical protein
MPAVVFHGTFVATLHSSFCSLLSNNTGVAFDLAGFYEIIEE